MKPRSKMALAGLALFLHGAAQAAPVSRMELMMGALLQVEAESDDPAAAQKAVEAALTEVQRWEGLLSNYTAKSEISRINREAYPESMVTTAEMHQFLREALHFSEATAGAYDLTMEPLSLLWNLRGRKLSAMPEDKKVDAIKHKVNYRNLELYSSDHSVRFLVDGMGIDTGGVWKGYALDRALQKARNFPVTSVTMNFGSEALYWSKEPRRAQIEVKNPLNPAVVWKMFIVNVDSTGAAVSTGENYDGYVVLESTPIGKKLGHIISPKTGRPAGGEVRSVTFVGPSASEADAFSAAVFVLGLKEGQRFAEGLKRRSVLVLYENPQAKLESFMSGEWEPAPESAPKGN